MKRKHEDRSSSDKNTEQGTQEAEGHVKGESSIRPGPSEVIKAKDQQENENSSICYSFTSSFCCSASVSKTDNKGCLYYVQVKTIKGVAVAWGTETGMEPIQKAPQIYELNPSEDSILESPHQSLPSEVLMAVEKNVDEMSEEYKEEEVPGPSSLIDERRRRKIPDWMVTTDNGYRCVACCQVFLTLEALGKHAESGPNEGFSCHVFTRKVHERQRTQKILLLGKDRRLTPTPKEQSKLCEGKGRCAHTSHGTQSIDLHHDKDIE
ncbi:protein FAM170A-like [Vombatus ursinus]|uniref:protein FAM170A-like n=1 Tax=Vombatus ursinus TaxID=29139 RepID=UPI000FFCEE4B|nr:protein FAM170A-like [Vombatus ursinus]